MKGLVHIYCGDGKGKTTAATGLAVRAAGNGMKVLFARFLKNESSGELKILDQIPEIDVLHLPKSFGFYQTLHVNEKQEMKQMYQTLWETVLKKISEGRYEVLVLDELMAACKYQILKPEEVLFFLKNRPVTLEIVMTGRGPEKEFIDCADYVSEIQKIKHPFDRNVTARKGIEF